MMISEGVVLLLGIVWRGDRGGVFIPCCVERWGLVSILCCWRGIRGLVFISCRVGWQGLWLEFMIGSWGVRGLKGFDNWMGDVVDRWADDFVDADLDDGVWNGVSTSSRLDSLPWRTLFCSHRAWDSPCCIDFVQVCTSFRTGIDELSAVTLLTGSDIEEIGENKSEEMLSNLARGNLPILRALGRAWYTFCNDHWPPGQWYNNEFITC